MAQSDIIGTAGQFAAQTGAKGAVANRKLADSLYKQSLADEKAAWSSGIPNVGLLSKALSESKDGKAADDQAKEFARGAIYGSQTGGTAGDYQAARYGALDQATLKDLANNSSPYAAAVQSKLGGYGMKLDPDKMVLNTPLGKFPIGMSADDLQKTLVSAAQSLGFKGDCITQGLADAVKTRDAMGKAAVAEAEREMAARKSGGDPADPTNAGGTADRASSPAAAVVEKAVITAPVGSQSGTDWDERQRSNEAHQDEIRRQLGLNKDVKPLGGADENIFERIHLRYRYLDERGEFLGGPARP